MTTTAVDPPGSGPTARRAEDERARAGAGRALLSALSSRTGWLIVVLVAAAALAVGSVHETQPSAATRISRLDSLIKCPSCVDLSIAQSDAPIAVGLRTEVAAWVHQGLSDGRIEQLVVSRFGEQVLLVPSGNGVDLLLWAVPLSVLGASGVLLAGYLWRRRRLEASP